MSKSAVSGGRHDPLSDLQVRGRGDRPPSFDGVGRPRTAPEVEQRIRDALATPARPGFHKIAAEFGVGTGTVRRIAAAVR